MSTRYLLFISSLFVTCIVKPVNFQQLYLGKDMQPVNQGSTFSSLLHLTRELPMLPDTWTTTFLLSSCKILLLPFGQRLLKADRIQQNILLFTSSRKEPSAIPASHSPLNFAVDVKMWSPNQNSDLWPLTFHQWSCCSRLLWQLQYNYDNETVKKPELLRFDENNVKPWSGFKPLTSGLP